jgi:hypothetical protein
MKKIIQLFQDINSCTYKLNFIIIFLIIYSLFFILPFSGLLYAAPDPQPEDGKVYMLIVDKLSINDINAKDTPHLMEIIDKGAVGLSSNRTLKGTNTMNAYLTVGAGNLARTNKTGIRAFNQDEIIAEQNQTASDYYYNLTSLNPGDSSCLLINLPDLLLGMAEESVNTVPGALGQVLKDNGYTTCVLGNGDTGSNLMRPGIAIAMDKQGQVTLGDIGPSTRIIASDSILGYKTNYEYLKQQAQKFQAHADLIVFDLTDLSRLENAETAFEEVTSREKLKILHEVDEFAYWAYSIINPEKDLLLIFSPSPGKSEILNKNNFTPVIVTGRGINQGYLTSPATHRDFIIANTDIAPSILNFFSLKDANNTMIGQPIQSIAANDIDCLGQAQELANNTSRTNRLRYPLITGYVAMLIIIIICASIIILKFKKLQPYLQPLIIAMVCYPLVLLPLGTIIMAYDFLHILLAISATIFFTAAFLALAKGNAYRAFVIISFITVLSLDIDVLTGTNLIQCSVLGYDPMAGARYYGIGNEYMGILIGASITSAAALYESFKNRWTLMVVSLFFIFQCALIGLPSLGANSDGLITAPLAFLVTLYLFSELRISLIGLLSILGIVVLSVLGISIYDLSRPVELQSHIGRAANQIFSGGLKEALLIIVRKLQVNIKLIKYTIWSRVFIVTLLALAIFIYFPVGAMKSLLQERPIPVKGFAGIVTAALVALIINDSGIVAASTTSIFLASPFLLMMIKHQQTKS